MSSASQVIEADSRVARLNSYSCVGIDDLFVVIKTIASSTSVLCARGNSSSQYPLLTKNASIAARKSGY
jgi:hypothetical protein